MARVLRRCTNRAAAIGAIGLLLFVAPACSSTSSPTASGQGSSTSSPTASSQAGSTSTNKVVGIVEYSADDTTGVSIAQNTSNDLKAVGYSAIISDANGEGSNANSICQTFVSRKVGAIVTITWTADQLAQCFQAATSAHIPVFNFGVSLAGESSGAILTDYADPVQNLFAASAAKDGIKDLLMLDYTPASSCLARQTSLNAKLKSLPGISVTRDEVTVPGQVVSAQNFTKAWLTGHPQPGSQLAVWACSGQFLMGALAAIKQDGRSGIQLWAAADLLQPMVSYIKDGQISATLWLDAPSMAEQIVSLVRDYDSNPSAWKPKELVGAYVIVTPSNIDSFLKSHPSVFN
jgi:ribose transport system substrate-binding protein